MESTQTLPEPVRSALDRGNLVEAIKLLRASGMDATAIKDGVDSYMRGKGRSVVNSARAGVARRESGAHEKAVTKSQPFVPRPTDDSYAYTNPAKGMSPGQMPDSNPFWWWLIAIAVAAILGVSMYGCASTPVAPVSEIARSGKLRAAIDIGNPILATKDAATGEARGVSVDIARQAR